MWQSVFEELRPGCPSSEAEIARAEDELGVPLPDSYRSFCRTCGAGLASGLIRIATPLPFEAADLVTRGALIAHSVGSAAQALAENPAFADRPFRFDVAGDDPSVLDRALFFGESEDGAFLFWDVQGTGEYDIWVMGADLESVRFGAESLDELFRDLQGPRVATILGPGAEPLPSRFEGIDEAVLARAGATA
ncbi:SMI1/KNR4 family protein [Methylobacterium durans]|uniref:SMI1/KNR4 family protein n=1 Tax=Methylobacterium durans TaxID=2202825 RepID=UPI002AFDD39C|nr:SMI1/KNR4 family protein [Methylobacterium durans]MEA1833843.1 SMI1/KNR4 family protein [Methylobacterium durans]